MTILLICDEYPPGRNGGIGTMIQTLSREFVRQGHRVLVAGLYAYSYGSKDYEEDQGVRIWRFRYGWNLGLPHHHLIHKLFNKIPGFIKQRLNGRKAFDKFIDFIRLTIKTENVEIIEIPDWNTFAMRIGFIVQWPEFTVPFVVKLHGSYSYLASEMKTKPKNYLYTIDQLLYKRADALAAVSAYTANRNKELFKLTAPIRILYNAIEINKIEAKEIGKEIKIIFTGTLIALKGIEQLMKAWNIVNKEMPSAELIIFGKGNSKNLLKMLNDQSVKKVSFAGHVSRDRLLTELAGATLAVFPSYTETFGLAAIEAMSVGCPVIFTKRASGPEIVSDKVNGELIDPDQVEEIASAIIRIAKDRNLQIKYSVNGRETVQSKFNVVNSVPAHIDFYNETIEQFKKI